MRMHVPVLRPYARMYYARKRLSKGCDELLIALNITLRTSSPYSMSLRLAIKATQEEASERTLPKMLAISFLACTLSTRMHTSNEFHTYSECLRLRAYFSIQTTCTCLLARRVLNNARSHTNACTTPVAVPTPILHWPIYTRTFRMLCPYP